MILDGEMQSCFDVLMPAFPVLLLSASASALGLDGGVRGDVYVHRRSAESGENSITVNYNYDPPPN